jgi:hypothetical protein
MFECFVVVRTKRIEAWIELVVEFIDHVLFTGSRTDI